MNKITIKNLMKTAATAFMTVALFVSAPSNAEESHHIADLQSMYSEESNDNITGQGLNTFTDVLDMAGTSIGNGEFKDQAADLFNAQPKGAAIEWLAQLFGRWVIAINNPGVSVEDKKNASLITLVAGYTNVIALVLGVVIISYVMLAGVINTAGSGEVLGKSWSTLWLPIRTALAFGLIMPLGQSGGNNATLAGGYLSSIQTSVVYLAVVGSNAADLVWNSTVDAVKRGTPVVLPPSGADLSIAGDIFDMAACGYYSAKQASFSEDGPAVDVMHVTYYPYDLKEVVEKKYVAKKITEKVVVPYDKIEVLNSVADKGTISKIEFGVIDRNALVGFFSDGEKAPCGTITLNPSYSDSLSQIKSGNMMEWLSGSDEKSLMQQAATINGEAALSKITINYIIGLFEIIPEKEVSVIGSFGSAFDKGGLGGMTNMMSYALREDAHKTNNEKYDQNIEAFKSNLNAVITAYAEKLMGFNATLYTDLLKALDAPVVGNSDGENIKADWSGVFAKEAKKGGWATAGLWYFELSKFQDAGNELIRGYREGIGQSDHAKPGECIAREWGMEVDTKTEMDEDDYKEWCNDNNLSSYKIAGLVHQKAFAMLRDQRASGNVADGVKLNEVVKMDDSDSQSGSGWAAQGILNKVLGLGEISTSASGGKGENAADQSVYDTSGTGNPFFIVTGIGHGINAIVGTLLVLAGVGKLFSLFAGKSPAGYVAGKLKEGLMKRILGGSDGEMGPFSMAMGMIMSMVFALLMGAGYTLAYVIPFMPIMIWTILILGWLVMVIEAVISAPLAVIMMATPEGEGISGRRMEKAISLIAGLILRPALSIMGLVASLGIAYVGFGIFNAFFWKTANAYTGWGIFELLALLTLYTTSALMICKYSFRFIHELPNHILEWMNTSGSRAFGENEAGGVVDKGVSGVGSQVSGAVGAGKTFLHQSRSAAASKAIADRKAISDGNNNPGNNNPGNNS